MLFIQGRLSRCSLHKHCQFAFRRRQNPDFNNFRTCFPSTSQHIKQTVLSVDPLSLSDCREAEVQGTAPDGSVQYLLLC